MRHWFALGALTLAGLFLDGQMGLLHARVVRAASAFEKIVAADTIVVGQVVAVEDKEVEVLPYPGAPNKLTYRVVSLKIDESILGGKGLTHVRVGFVPRGEAGGAPIGDAPARAAFNTDPQIKVGQEGCFFLARHPTADFFVLPRFGTPTDKKAADFAKQVDLARRASKLLADPAASLKVRDAGDRFFTAAVLINRYRTPPPRRGNQLKEVAIPADESKLLLAAIHDADWTKNEDFLVSPYGVFMRLSQHPTDGFKFPKAQPGQDYIQQVAPLAKAWLKENLDTYRIKKFVVEERKDEK